MKTKALKQFKADDAAVKVIMLSLGKAAAGTLVNMHVFVCECVHMPAEVAYICI